MAKAKITPKQALESGGHYEFADSSPAPARNLRMTLSACHWHYAQQTLEILEWVCGTDRQFARARTKVLDLINGQDRAMTNIVNRSFGIEVKD